MDERVGRFLRGSYRDALALYGALAVVIVLFAALLGGDVSRAVVIALGFWVVATAWTWFRLRRRESRS